MRTIQEISNNASEPEDTFILLDALELDANALQEAKPAVCLEIGYVINVKGV